MRIGILGAGAVSHLYLPNLVEMGSIEIAGIADLDADLAAKVASQYGVGPMMMPDELIADPSIEILLNLTTIRAHVATTTAALRAGKHVYSEKPLATSVADAQALADLARELGLALCCAPDTLLASGFQVPLARLAGGAVGRPLTATATMLRAAMPGPSGYTVGSFPFFDMGPYYVSALLWLLGPVTRVSGAARMWPAGERLEDASAGFPISLASTLEFASGATAGLTLGWGIEPQMEMTVLDLFGTTGVLGFPNPNTFSGPAFLRPYGAEFAERSWSEVPGSRQSADLPANLRGLGISEMATALGEGRAPRLGADLAVHTVDVLAGLVESAETGKRVELTTTFARPEPLGAEELVRLLA